MGKNRRSKITFTLNDFDSYEGVALEVEGKTYSFAQLKHDIAERLEAFDSFRAIVVQSDSRSYSFVCNVLALFLLGKPQLILPNKMKEQEKEKKLKKMGSFVEISDVGVIIGEGGDKSINPHPDALFLLLTSGSSGEAKIVQLSRANVENCMKSIIKTLDFSTAQEQTLFLPLSYSFGLLGQLVPGLFAGLPTKILKEMTELGPLIHQGQLSGLVSGVASHFEGILKIMQMSQRPTLETVSHVVLAGEPISVPLRKRLLQSFPKAIVYCNYGQTELSPRALVLSSQSPFFLTEATGYPIGELKAEIRDDELFFSGPHVMLGYLGSDHSGKLINGSLATGDMATIAPDGLVTVRGRKDSLVKIGGERFSLKEVENMLMEYEGIERAIVALDSSRAPLVNLEAFIQASKPIERQELLGHLRKNLSDFKIPTKWYDLREVPLTANGKVDHKDLTGNKAALFKWA